MKEITIVGAAIGIFVLFSYLLGAPWFVTATEIICVTGILYVSWPDDRK